MNEHEKMVQALREVLTEGEQSEKAMLIKRIPFICNDIRDINVNLWWHRWLLLGIAGGIGLLALKTLGL